MTQCMVDLDKANVPYALYKNVCSVAVGRVFCKSQLQKMQTHFTQKCMHQYS